MAMETHQTETDNFTIDDKDLGNQVKMGGTDHVKTLHVSLPK